MSRQRAWALPWCVMWLLLSMFIMSLAGCAHRGRVETTPEPDPPVCDLDRLNAMDAILIVNPTRVLVPEGATRTTQVCFFGTTIQAPGCITLKEIEEFMQSKRDAQ